MAIVTINKDNFENIIHSGKPVLVEFMAPWCTYCRRIQDAMEAVSEQHADTLITGAVNIDDSPELEDSFEIELVPTLLFFRDGTLAARLPVPTSKAMIDSFLAESIPRKSGDDRIRDTVILGGGPAGYTAALYAARAGLDTLVLEKLSAGGQMNQTTQIDNYSGFEEGIDGYTLGQKMKSGAERFGAETIMAEVESAELDGAVKAIRTSEGNFQARTVILATGAVHRHLGLEKETALVGKGVAYCAACDGMFFRDKTVALVGGGNSAAADAMILSRIVKKVFLLVRGDTLRATKIYHEPLMNTENIEILWNSSVTELLHEERLTGVRIHNSKTGRNDELSVDGLFVSVGRAPVTELFRGQITLDQDGYIVADESTRTNLPGVYAVGDVRTKALRQIITAAADGAVAAHYAEEYLLHRG